MYTLGIDIGSSSVKVALFDADKGKSLGNAFSPSSEMEITSSRQGWAEQAPEDWWDNFQVAFKEVLTKTSLSPSLISGIGIAYQMHGLVLVNQKAEVIRPAIIWCDSRAVAIGNKAFEELGWDYCRQHLLNSPGNFTASKLKWVKDSEPENLEKTRYFMLPGDYIAFKLSGTATTTASGLSEGIFWDYKEEKVSKRVLDYFGFEERMIPDIVPSFGKQCVVSETMAHLLGMKKGTPITYRAGDQPNNAFALNVLQPGEVAATAGTSGVIYAVMDEDIQDDASRINTFRHVNSSEQQKRNGLLLCVNGTGRLNSWLRDTIAPINGGYDQMNEAASRIPIGADNLLFYPFGNGAERLLQNRDTGATLEGMQFNLHHKAHLYRAAQEGIVFALNYGFEVLGDLGVSKSVVRAGKANMFLSPVFREAFCNTVDTQLQLYDTDGAVGAARGAALGNGFYESYEEAFRNLECLESIAPDRSKTAQYKEVYQQWKSELEKKLSHD